MSDCVKGKVLAKYSIPLGANEATLVFTGEGQLSPDDFDALSEYVTLFKKQLQRKAKAATVVSEISKEEEDQITDEEILKHAPER